MREEFADKYNLITIQCDYFGYEFMQDTDQFIISTKQIQEKLKLLSDDNVKTIYRQDNLDFDKFLEKLKCKSTSLVVDINLQESR